MTIALRSLQFSAQLGALTAKAPELRFDLAPSDVVVLLDASPDIAGDAPPDPDALAIAQDFARPLSWGLLPWVYATNGGGGALTFWRETGRRAQRPTINGGGVENIPVRYPATVAVGSLLAGAVVLAPTGETDTSTGDPMWRRAVVVCDRATGIAVTPAEGGDVVLPTTADAFAAPTPGGTYDRATLVQLAPDGTTRWFELAHGATPITRVSVASGSIAALSTFPRGSRVVAATPGGAWVVAVIA